MRIKAHGDPVRCLRVSGRAGLRPVCTGLLFGKAGPVLDLRHCTGQELDRLPAITTQGGAQLGPAYDCGQILWHDPAGMIAPFAIHQATGPAIHEHEPL